MLAAAAIVFVGAVGLLVLAWHRRGRKGLPLLGESERANTGLVVFFGMAVPIVVVSAVFVWANLIVIRKTEPPGPGESELTVVVTGHQWWWEVRYPGTPGAVTANEVRIPTGTTVNVLLRSADVIHSFWVPELNRKVDMVPGRMNRVGLYTDKPGVYGGQCAEFCGLQHANMAFDVYAYPPREFRTWLDHAAAPAQPPRSGEARQGRRVFLGAACSSCHTIRGTSAAGNVGPDLTHIADRESLAAETIPNTHDYLSRWVRSPQEFKPGNRMPALELSDPDFDAIASYLSGLR